LKINPTGINSIETAKDRMNLRLASTFNDKLLKLTGNEQKAVKTTAFYLQVNSVKLGIH